MDSATLSPSCDVFGLEQMGTQKISVVSDQTNGFHHNNEKSDSFVLDIESFSHAIDRDITPNSRITLQRSLSRKGSHRGGQKKTSPNATANEKDTIVATSSPKGTINLNTIVATCNSSRIGESDSSLPNRICLVEGYYSLGD